MEDVATAEIARSQIWQWVYHRAAMKGGAGIDRDLVLRIENEELAKLRDAYGKDAFGKMKFSEARKVFEEVALGEGFTEFLTPVAYDRLG